MRVWDTQTGETLERGPLCLKCMFSMEHCCWCPCTLHLNMIWKSRALPGPSPWKKAWWGCGRSMSRVTCQHGKPWFGDLTGLSGIPRGQKSCSVNSTMICLHSTSIHREMTESLNHLCCTMLAMLWTTHLISHARVCKVSALEQQVSAHSLSWSCSKSSTFPPE